jgi:type II secretory pathway component PulC
MAEDPRLTAVEYVDRFFDELREEVRSNPALASRLVKALGGTIVFEDETKADVANPYVLAANGSKSQFYSVYGSLKTHQIKQILRDNNLATRLDMAGKSTAQLIDMLFDRASTKVQERKSTLF